MNRKAHISIVLAIVACSFLFYAHSSGVTNVTQKNGTGCNCHSSTPSSAVTVAITGPDQISAGATETYTVTITGGPLTRGGTNIAASAGDLNPVDGQGLQKIVDELTHSLPKAPSGGTVSFQFTYTAPIEEGSVTLYANGNSVNFNGNNTGDQWNFAQNKTVTVTGPTGVDDETIVRSYKLQQNYPNPFNPSTQINFSLAEPGNVQLKVYNVTGDEVATLADGFRAAGDYNIAFNAAGLSSGIYFYKLITGSFAETKKMVLTK